MSAEMLHKLKQITRNSIFARSPNYTVNVQFRTFFEPNGALLTYNFPLKEKNIISPMTHHEIIAAMTPEFQRSNTAWTQPMQIKFIENLLGGCRTELHLFEVKGRGAELDECSILDGLQRSTAIADFQSNSFSIFDGMFTWKDICSGGIFPRLNLSINIFSFDSEVDACRFYIQFNQNITHNESDLETAYAFMRKHGATW